MTRRLTRVAVAIGAAALALLPAAAQAAAAPHGRIIEVKTVNGSLRVLFAAAGLDAGSSIATDSVKLTIDGTNVVAKAAPVGTATAAQVRRSALLVIDTSGSMAAEGLAGAKSAATAFLSAVPSDVRVGLVAFSDTAHVVVAPTANRTAVRSAISRLHAAGETALYDGVALGLRSLGAGGARNMVLLTDGADTRSKTKLNALLPKIVASKVTIDAVGFRTTDAQTAPLRQIAAAGGGQVISATQASALATAFASAASDIAHQIVVTAPVPAQFQNGSHTVAVSATAGSTTLSDQALALIGAAGAAKTPNVSQFGPKPATVSHGLSKSALWAALIALFVGASVLLWGAVSGLSHGSGSSGVRRRLSIYTLTGRPVEETREETTMLGDSAVARSAVELAGRVVSSRDLESMLAQRLDAAGVPMKPPEWMILHVGIAVAGGVLLLLISGGGLLATVLGFLAGLIGPWLYLSMKESRRTSAFLERMPDTLQLMAGGLLAGYSLPQSVDAVVRDGSEPIASEFNRALVETRLGVTVEDALEGVGQRMRSVDFGWVVMAIRIQREVGGNLAEVLTTVSATLRERERLRRQVRVLSAEGRLSAWILGCLPLLFFIYLLLVRHEYIQKLWTDPIGVFLIVVMCVSLTVGALWLRKVVQVEV